MSCRTQDIMKEEKQYRFIVRSAEEAVKVLRERLGESARVVSVRQMEGGGLSRFLQAPKLEVIAALPSATATEAGAKSEQAPGTSITPEEVVATMMPETISIARAEEEEIFLPAYAPEVRREPAGTEARGETRVARLLRVSGLPGTILARLQALPDWAQIEALEVARALPRVATFLRGEWERLPVRSASERIAFLGTPGSGKTTTLCKQLAQRVFLQQKPARVLKLDLDQPNPSDGLAIFCEALGVPYLRDLEGAEMAQGDDALLVDVPGLAPNEAETTRVLSSALDRLEVRSRVMVINAAYESTLIKRAYRFALDLRCTHVAFTHLDELEHWGKLWEFLLNPTLTPLLLSSGQNLGAGVETSVFETMLAKTFPGLRAPAALGTSDNR